MNDTTRLDQTGEEILTYEVPDEALEAAGGTTRDKAPSWRTIAHRSSAFE